MRRHLLSLGLMLVWGCSSCSSSSKTDGGPRPDTPADRVAYFVGPEGSDRASGTSRDTPFRTVGHALSRDDATVIFLEAGTYDESVDIARPIELLGAGMNRSTIGKASTIRASGVVVRGLDFGASLTVTGAGLSFEDGRIEAGAAENALSIENSQVSLARTEAIGGLETCVQTVGSTVSIDGLRLRPGANIDTKRGLWARSSSVTATAIDAQDTLVSAVQAAEAGFLHIDESTLGTVKSGSQLSAISRVRVIARDISIPAAGPSGIVVARAQLVLRDSTIGDASGVPASIQGGSLELHNVELGVGAFGSLSVVNHVEQTSDVLVIGGVMRHGEKSAVSVTQGRVEIRNTRFVGLPDAQADGEDTLIAASEVSEIIASGVTIEDPAGNGVAFLSGAQGSFSGAVLRPRLSGFFIEGSAGGEITIENARVESCRTGPGVVALDSTGVKVLSTTINNCAEGGVLLGQSAAVHVEGSEFVDNPQYGLAAFGGSTISVSGTTVRGSPWATFATCADGSRIEDQGSNTFDGPTTNCP